MGKGKIIAIIIGVVVVAGLGYGAYSASKPKTVNSQTVAVQNTAQNNETSEQKVEQKQDEPKQEEAKKDEPKNETTQEQANKKDDSSTTVNKQDTNKQDANKNESATKPNTTTTNSSTNNSTSGSSNETIPVGQTISQIVPNGNIIKAAQSYAVPANEVNQMIAGKYKGTQKEVFLTFDDGPSTTTTPEILNILNKYGVHATFFVLGSELGSQKAKDIVKDEILQGNAIADHSYSHDYAKLYPHNSVDVNAFMNEFNKTNDILRSFLGANFNSRIVRMPGGYMSRAYYHDKNLPALNSAFAKDGIVSIDWTAESGDAEGKNYSVSQLVQNAINESKGYTHVVLLMHDIKPKTVQALPQIIEYYKSQGYEFKVISNSGIN